MSEPVACDSQIPLLQPSYQIIAQLRLCRLPPIASRYDKLEQQDNSRRWIMPVRAG